MDNKTDKKSTDASLLTLNDDCLMQIFQYLNLSGHINLWKTGCRFQDVAHYSGPEKIHLYLTLSREKFNKALVPVYDYYGCKKTSMEKFASILSMIGKNVSSIKVNKGNLAMLTIIRDNCINLSSLELYDCEVPSHMTFEHLKELKLYGNMDCDVDFKQFFGDNQNIERLEYGSFYNESLTGLLNMLPKLISLRLELLSFELKTHLLSLDGITKFSFRSPENCNQLLLDLAKKWKYLVQLEIDMDLNTETFDIIKSFRHLAFLSVEMHSSSFRPATSDYPPRLRRLKLDGVKIDRETFLSIVRGQAFLEEFDVGDGQIFSNSTVAGHFPNSLNDGGRSGMKVVSEIADLLNIERGLRTRTLKLVYYKDETKHPQNVRCDLYHFKVINSWLTANERKTHCIHVSSDSPFFWFKSASG